MPVVYYMQRLSSKSTKKFFKEKPPPKTLREEILRTAKSGFSKLAQQAEDNIGAVGKGLYETTDLMGKGLASGVNASFNAIKNISRAGSPTNSNGREDKLRNANSLKSRIDRARINLPKIEVGQLLPPGKEIGKPQYVSPLLKPTTKGLLQRR